MDDIERLEKKIAEREGEIRKLREANDRDRKTLQRKRGGKSKDWFDAIFG